MREIKFRGKSLESGLWVYGYVIFSKPFADGKRSAWIIEESILPLGAVSTPTSKFIQVDPETVGQFTGLRDRNRINIYEGGICKVLYTDWLSKSSEDPRTLDQYLYDISHTMMVEWVAPGFEFVKTGFDPASMHVGEHGRIEVIGNIHENSELLK